LIARGVSNSEACRLVGVNRRTGTRWRYGRTVTSSSGAELHYPPMATTRTACLSARFLSEDERVLIADRVRAGASLRAIGRELVRLASTVSREVRRNRDEAGRYRLFTAHRMALRRLVRQSTSRLEEAAVSVGAGPAGQLPRRDTRRSWLGRSTPTASPHHPRRPGHWAAQRNSWQYALNVASIRIVATSRLLSGSTAVAVWVDVWGSIPMSIIADRSLLLSGMGIRGRVADKFESSGGCLVVTPLLSQPARRPAARYG